MISLKKANIREVKKKSKYLKRRKVRTIFGNTRNKRVFIKFTRYDISKKITYKFLLDNHFHLGGDRTYDA